MDAAATDDFDRLITAEEWMRKKYRLVDGWHWEPDLPPHFKDKEHTWIDARALIGCGTIIFPGCVIIGPCTIGKNCVLWPNTVLVNALVDDDVVMGLPIVKNVRIGRGTVIGATAELNRTTLGEGVKDVHHGYLGDTTVGDRSNIGAGTITANYDGKAKHRTAFGPRTFTGVHTSIIAPNEFPEGTYIAAGSTIPANLKESRRIPPFSLLISRAKELFIKARKEESR